VTAAAGQRPVLRYCDLNDLWQAVERPSNRSQIVIVTTALAPPVSCGTLGSSLTPDGMILRSVFSFFPSDVGPRLLFLKCSAPHFFTSSSSCLLSKRV